MNLQVSQKAGSFSTILATVSFLMSIYLHEVSYWKGKRPRSLANNENKWSTGTRWKLTWIVNGARRKGGGDMVEVYHCATERRRRYGWGVSLQENTWPCVRRSWHCIVVINRMLQLCARSWRPCPNYDQPSASCDSAVLDEQRNSASQMALLTTIVAYRLIIVQLMYWAARATGLGVITLIFQVVVARMGKTRGAYKILVGMPEGSRPLGRPGSR
jgi:hypothetical protein